MKKGRPRIIEDGDQLLELFEEYSENETKLLTIEGFMYFCKYEKKLIKNMLYWFDLGEDFSKGKKEIEMLMKKRYDELAIDKENSTSYLIFYGKNKFKMSDNIKTENVNINQNVELTEEQLSEIIGE